MLNLLNVSVQIRSWLSAEMRVASCELRKLFEMLLDTHFHQLFVA